MTMTKLTPDGVRGTFQMDHAVDATEAAELAEALTSEPQSLPTLFAVDELLEGHARGQVKIDPAGRKQILDALKKATVVGGQPMPEADVRKRHIFGLSKDTLHGMPRAQKLEFIHEKLDGATL